DLLTAVGRGSGTGQGGRNGRNGRSGEVEVRLKELHALRALYEPYIEGLAEYLLMGLPPWAPAPGALDDWQTTADGWAAPSVTSLAERGHTGTPMRHTMPAERSPDP